MNLKTLALYAIFISVILKHVYKHRRTGKSLTTKVKAMTARQQRKENHRNKVRTFQAIFINAFDNGGLEKAQNRFKQLCKDKPQETSVIREAYKHIEHVFMKSC
jgi:hypothetical protein